MTSPTVCCVMLANGREAMVRRAAWAFRAQTYQQKWLVIFDSGEPYLNIRGDPSIIHVDAHRFAGQSIGSLRNAANTLCSTDIIAHFDSDDFSAPERLTEQVALLQSSGADAVGYNRMLFWREPEAVRHDYDSAIELMRRVQDYPEGFDPDVGQAWLYANGNPRYALGTSLCYWRQAWEAKPFRDLNTGEDMFWELGLNVKGVDSVGAEPRMIASIHGGNTTARITPGVAEWKRAPEWDEYVRRVMAP